MQGKLLSEQHFFTSTDAVAYAQLQQWLPKVCKGNKLWIITPYLKGVRQFSWGTTSYRKAREEARAWLLKRTIPGNKWIANLYADGCAALEHPIHGCIARIEVSPRIMTRKE